MTGFNVSESLFFDVCCVKILKSFFISAGLLLSLYSHDYFNPVSSPEEKLYYPALVDKFYQQNHNRLFWFAPLAKELRLELINCMDTVMSYGLIAEPYHYEQLKQNLKNNSRDSLTVLKKDRIFTDAAIACMKDLSEGFKPSPWVGYDQVSSNYKESNDQFLLDRLLNCFTAVELKNLMESLQPQDKKYKLLKEELRLQKQKGDKKKIKQLSLSLNYLRWIDHFHFEKTIVVNIASAHLSYYEKDSLALSMKVIVGKPSTPTPRFATWCDQVILYPYWYVPRSIALNEYLNKFKRNPALVDAFNMQVVDGNGKIMNPYKLDWSSFGESYFPYTLRQSTGCDNALGIIKFNLTTPYGVYLHDTNNKTAFLSGYRYYSHGCIRMEKPIELGNRLLHNELDTAFLQSCYKDQQPIPIELDQPVPVFVVYIPAETNDEGMIDYYKDVYKLLK